MDEETTEDEVLENVESMENMILWIYTVISVPIMIILSPILLCIHGLELGFHKVQSLIVKKSKEEN